MRQATPGAPRRGRGSSSPSSRYSPPEVRRRQILSAAAVVFAKKGFPATRMSDVAEEAGVAQGTLYRFFDNKDDLALALFSIGEQEQRAKLEDLIDKQGASDPRQVVEDYIAWYARYLVRRRELLVALFAWELDPAGRHGADIGERPYIAERLAALFDAADLEFPPEGVDVGRFLPVVVYGFTALWHLYRAPGAESEATQTIVDIVRRILRLDDPAGGASPTQLQDNHGVPVQSLPEPPGGRGERAG